MNYLVSGFQPKITGHANKPINMTHKEKGKKGVHILDTIDKNFREIIIN